MPPSSSKSGQEPSVTYESKPPEWTVPATRNGDLGYHGFYPPRPGQDEELLTDNTILFGYSEPSFVAGTDAFGGVFKQNGKNGLDSLRDIMERVLTKRAELHAVVEPNTFKYPSRVTLVGDKKTSWYADLANPEVPLHTIPKSTLTSPKNSETLDLLYSMKTPVDRAAWYIGNLGAIDTVRRSLYIQPCSKLLFSLETVKKLLVDIAMPNPLKSGVNRVNIIQVFKKSKLNDPEWKEAWVAKYAWS
ncbi:11466_t:CDS:2, partial [Acaulospora colombiana]